MPITASVGGATYDGVWYIPGQPTPVPAGNQGLKIGVVGTFNWGPMDTPALCASPTSLYSQFGDTVGTGLTGINEAMPLYANKSTKVYVVRCGDGSEAAATYNLMDTEATAAEAAVATAAYKGSKGNTIKIDVKAASNGTATLNDIVVTLGNQVETYKNVSVDPGVSSNLFTQSTKAQIVKFTAPVTAPAAYPGLKIGTFTLTGGTDGTAAIAGSDYIGTASPRTGLNAFGVLPDGSSLDEVYLAGQSDSATMTSLFTWGTDHNVFAHGSIPQGTVITDLAAITQALDNQFAEYAYNWQQVTDPFSGQLVWVSPAAFAAGVSGAGNAWDSIENVSILGSEGSELSLVPVDDYPTILAARVNAIGPIPAGGIGFITEFNLSTNNAENFITDTLMQMYIANQELSALGWASGKLMNTDWMRRVRNNIGLVLDPLVTAGVVGDVAGKQAPYVITGDLTNNTTANLSQGNFNIQQTVLLIPHNRKLLINSEVSRTATTVTIQSA